MAYDLEIADKLRTAVSDIGLLNSEALTERKMFGGICFMSNGSMIAGVIEHSLIIRLSDNDMEKSLMLPHVKPMDFNGRSMKNFAYIDPSKFLFSNVFIFMLFNTFFLNFVT